MKTLRIKDLEELRKILETGGLVDIINTVNTGMRLLGASPTKQGRLPVLALIVGLMAAGFTSAQTERPTSPGPTPSPKSESKQGSKDDATADLLREMERRELAERAANAQYKFTPQQGPFDPSGRPAQRGLVAAQLSSIIIPEFSLAEETPFVEAIKALSEAAKQADPEGRGIKFIISSSLPKPEFDGLMSRYGLQRPAGPAFPQPEEFHVPKLAPLRGLKVGEILAIVLNAARPRPPDTDPLSGQPLPRQTLRMAIEDNAIVVSAPPPPATNLHTRRFSIPDVAGFLNVIGSDGTTTAVQKAVRNFIADLGINPGHEGAGEPTFGAPPQNAFFLNDRTGLLFARATIEDLNVIEDALHQILLPAKVQITGVLVEVAGDSSVLARPFFEAAKPTLDENTGKELRLLGTMTSLEFGRFRPELGSNGATVLMSPTITTRGFRVKEETLHVQHEGDVGGAFSTEVSFTATPLPSAPPKARVGAKVRLFKVDAASGEQHDLLAVRGSGEIWDRQTLVFGVRAPEGEQFYLLFVTPMILPKDLEAP